MANASPERLRLRAQIGAATRHHPNTDTTELRRELAEVKIADYIRSIVAEAPPLRPEQRDRLANLLRGGADR
ncbi:hypothetical protein SAMN05421833_108206 [Microbispora rosea]|uniref:PhiRv1 phage protein n=1 Tax=Microbispora rosea TaxID=58117 RepID=A0A1N7AI67_9ACTN|nr:hypothetical protein Mro03_71110 [Microbispora rosea subsp. rosea]SIR38749.1 hypothetical protein SAMN05421833_108206 [Microbispora rosea]